MGILLTYRFTNQWVKCRLFQGNNGFKAVSNMAQNKSWILGYLNICNY